MGNRVKKIMLFTLSACPMGRSMGTVLSEIKNKFPVIEIETNYVEVMTDITNHYKIKENPTTLILDKQSNELYRVEGFIETDELIDTIDKINKSKLESSRKFESNQETVETYTIYFYKNKDIVPLEMHYNNVTSVQAPRITVINLLINTKIDGYENPFPLSSKLEHVSFNQHRGDVVIHIDLEEVEKATMNKMKLALAKTLSHFGIKDVQLTIVN